jgi:hypothetical protein
VAFKDTYTAPEFSGSFIKGEEKATLIKQEAEFPITGVRLIPNGSYDKKSDQYVVQLELDGEARSLGFTAGTVWTRDDLLDKLVEYFDAEADAEAVPAKLTREGQAVLIELV